MAAMNPGKGPARRYYQQLSLIRDAIPELGTFPENWFDDPRGPVTIFDTRTLLVRDEYLGRVQALVGGAIDRGLIRGVTSIRLDTPRPIEALAQIERQLGRGVASPDHFVGICPPSRCPASEPRPVRDAAPVPVVKSERSCHGRSIKIAVIDTGLLDGATSAHSWLAGVTGDSEGPMKRGQIEPYVGHGTFIAGVIRSIAPKVDVNVTLVPGTRAGEWRESDMVVKLDEALASGADIISLSAGTNTYGDAAMLALDAWYQVSLSHRPDVVFVAAAGNNASSVGFWPAAFPWALSVGATNLAGTKRAKFSNYGPWVKLYAPGEDLVNAYAIGDYMCNEPPVGEVRSFGNGLARWSGTSFSAPMVAAMIAARATDRMIDVQTARRELEAIAAANPVKGVGPVLMPEMACAERGVG